MLAKDHRLPPNFAHGKFPGCFNGHLGFASDTGGKEKIAIPIRENVRIKDTAPCVHERNSLSKAELDAFRTATADSSINDIKLKEEAKAHGLTLEQMEATQPGRGYQSGLLFAEKFNVTFIRWRYLSSATTP